MDASTGASGPRTSTKTPFPLFNSILRPLIAHRTGLSPRLIVHLRTAFHHAPQATKLKVDLINPLDIFDLFIESISREGRKNERGGECRFGYGGSVGWY